MPNPSQPPHRTLQHSSPKVPNYTHINTKISYKLPLRVNPQREYPNPPRSKPKAGHNHPRPRWPPSPNAPRQTAKNNNPPAQMTANAFHNIAQIETSLWEAADQLRANSNLTATEYSMPVLGVIFLRHATNRYQTALQAIEAAQAAGTMPKRPLVKGDFIKRRALMLPEAARYDTLLNLPSGASLGGALVAAMNAIEADFAPLQGSLPKEYDRFDNKLLENLLRCFDSQALRQATGDVFGRIYEYFLMKFAMQGAQDNGEFFTPPSLVQTLVNIIEPDHGVVADLACGSGGMFVQSSHFIEQSGQETMNRVTFYGQEKTPTTIRLAKMNLAVHGLEGDIQEANTFYDDPHRLPGGKPLWGNVDFMMANPPFNVDKVDAEAIKTDRRLPFGLPGVNKDKHVSNGNYLWISYFHSYLSPTGRAGFVMSSQASSAGHGEKEVRRKLVETGDVDVMVAIRSNFFSPAPCPASCGTLTGPNPQRSKTKCSCSTPATSTAKSPARFTISRPSNKPTWPPSSGCTGASKAATWGWCTATSPA